MPASINSKDIPRHAALLATKAQAKVDQDAVAARGLGVKAMKDAWAADRVSNPNAPITPAQQTQLARIQAAAAGLIDPD